MKHLMALWLISLLLIVSCAQQAQTGTQQEIQSEVQPAEEKAGTTADVPAAENENIEEMAVNDDSEAVMEDNSNVIEIEIAAKKWEFDPAIITVKEGDRVRLSIKSIDVSHGIAIPDFDVSQTLEPGKTELVEFTADKKGTYTFFCSVFCGSGHRSMKGTLVVE